jgi:formylmethanofuran dehydrogenase subunit C
MAALTFTLRERPAERLDLSALTPGGLAALKAREIEAIVVGGGRRPVRVGDVFKVRAGTADDIVFAGGSDRFDRLGAGLSGGSIRVEGDVGARLGLDMLDGVIAVAGSAGPWAGSGMQGGRITVAGDAGDFAGGALPGRMAGMRGGVLAVGGGLGARAGDRMRRGLVVARRAGEETGSRMIAGTIVAGTAGPLPGRLMRRGSLIVGAVEGEVLPTFLDCGEHDLQAMAILAGWLGRLALPWRPRLGGAVRRLQGDTAALGKGELLIAA